MFIYITNFAFLQIQPAKISYYELGRDCSPCKTHYFSPELAFKAPCQLSTTSGFSQCNLAVDGKLTSSNCAVSKDQKDPWLWVDLTDYHWVAQVRYHGYRIASFPGSTELSDPVIHNVKMRKRQYVRILIKRDRVLVLKCKSQYL